jgi:hypothetical protein
MLAPERSRERFGIGEAGLVGDVGNACTPVEHELHGRAAQAQQLHEARYRDAGVVGELAMEMEARKVRDATEGIHAQLVIEMSVDVVQHLVDAARITCRVFCFHLACRYGLTPLPVRPQVPAATCS